MFDVWPAEPAAVRSVKGERIRWNQGRISPLDGYSEELKAEAYSDDEGRELDQTGSLPLENESDESTSEPEAGGQIGAPERSRENIAVYADAVFANKSSNSTGATENYRLADLSTGGFSPDASKFYDPTYRSQL